MCISPKRLFVKSPTEKKYELFVPCGKCSECLEVNRASWVRRMMAEFSSSGSCAFVTLKYTDNNLIYYKTLRDGFTYDTSRILESIELKKRKNEPFLYKHFCVSKKHASEFIKNMQNNIKVLRSDYLVRFYLTSEYGTYNSRPHYHAILYFPCKLTLDFIKDFTAKCWRYGDVEVEPVNILAINYVAKHEIKDDAGSDVQRKYAPIFSKMSRYNGGIGVSLENDSDCISSYNSGKKTILFDGYKIPIPRYILRRFRGDVPLLDSELKDLENSSLGSFSLKFISAFNERFDGDWTKYLNFVKECADVDFNNKLTYKKQKFVKKMITLKRQGYFYKDNNV